jgi:hypothetical protein
MTRPHKAAIALPLSSLNRLSVGNTELWVVLCDYSRPSILSDRNSVWEGFIRCLIDLLNHSFTRSG